VVERRFGKPAELVAERAVAPAQLVTFEAARDGDDAPAAGAELVDTILECGGDADPAVGEPGNIVDAVLQRAVGIHVVDEAADGDADAVACLFDAFDVAFHPALVHLPHASQVRHARSQRLRAAIEDAGRPVFQRRVRRAVAQREVLGQRARSIELWASVIGGVVRSRRRRHRALFRPVAQQAEQPSKKAADHARLLADTLLRAVPLHGCESEGDP
jgi:hypothetical protein